MVTFDDGDSYHVIRSIDELDNWIMAEAANRKGKE
jgi:hypothetical protein